jgi:hypothetical protein
MTYHGNVVKDMNWDNKGTKAWRIFCPACNEHHAPIEGRWTFNGDYEKPTFSPSLLVTSAYKGDINNYVCHSYITDGKIQYLSDCTHELAGQTIDLKPMD